jgi:hypothetical protein
VSKRTEVTSLYRFYRADGLLLYVGISKNPPERFTQHKGDKPWWTEVHSIRLEHFDTRKEAAKAERRAITEEEPAYNIADYHGDHSWWDYLAAREPALEELAERLTEVIELGGCSEAALNVAYSQTRRLVGPGRNLSPMGEQVNVLDGLRRCMDLVEFTQGTAPTSDEGVLRRLEAKDHVHAHLKYLAPVCGWDRPCYECYPETGWDIERRAA